MIKFDAALLIRYLCCAKSAQVKNITRKKISRVGMSFFSVCMMKTPVLDLLSLEVVFLRGRARSSALWSAHTKARRNCNGGQQNLRGTSRFYSSTHVIQSHPIGKSKPINIFIPPLMRCPWPALSPGERRTASHARTRAHRAYGDAAARRRIRRSSPLERENEPLLLAETKRRRTPEFFWQCGLPGGRGTVGACQGTVTKERTASLTSR